MIATPPVQFRGWTACRRDGEGPLGLIIIGVTVEQPDEVAQLAFSAAAPADIPDALEDVRVERLGDRQYRIVAGSKEWIVNGIAHMHREVDKAFAAAIPRRAVPWRKRMFWWLALRLAANRFAQRVFRAH